MGRRGQDRRRQCAESGCREITITHYDTQRDYAEAVRREKGQPPWKCLRHNEPDKVLRIDNRHVMYDCASEERWYTNYRGERSLTGVYWDGHGFVHGPGFRAYASDFPAGTRLVITASVVLPEDYEPPAPPESKPVTRYQTDAVDLDG